MHVAGGRNGVAASVTASVLFASIFLLPPHLRPLSPTQFLGYRIVAMLAFLALFFAAARMWGQVRVLGCRLRAAPKLIPVIILDAALLGTQLWLFGWAPQTGHGLEVSLGYLILPLVMVAVSVIHYREPLSRLRVAAVACAAVGVGAAVVGVGGIGWATAVVALGFPPYFVCRRAAGLDSPAAQVFELAALLPFSLATFVASPSAAMVAEDPRLVGWLVLLGLLSSAAFAAYLTASRVLPFALFGVLGYVEPILLVVVSITVLGEPLRPADGYTYGPICAGLALLAVESLRATRRVPR